MEIRVGMVGYGEMGRRHALAWRALALSGVELPGRIRLVAVAAPGPEGDAARDEAGFELAMEDPEEVIAHPEVDIIDVCAPRAVHASALRSAMAAGKHLYCAHPLAGDDRDAEEIAALGGRIPGRKQMATDHLWRPALARARSLIRDGRIGEPQSFRLACHRSLGAAGGEDPDVAGSALYGLLPHALDVTRAWNGDIAEACSVVEAMLDPQAVEAGPTLQSVSCLLRFANGSVGVLDAACTAAVSADSLRVELFGSEGRVAYDLDWPDVLTVWGTDGQAVRLTDAKAAPGTLPGDVLGLGAFLRSVELDEPAEPDFRDGLIVQRTIRAIRQSAEEGAWQPVDLGR